MMLAGLQGIICGESNEEIIVTHKIPRHHTQHLSGEWVDPYQLKIKILIMAI